MGMILLLLIAVNIFVVIFFWFLGWLTNRTYLTYIGLLVAVIVSIIVIMDLKGDI